MKKVTILAVLAIAVSLASCTAQSQKSNLKSEIDSLSYAHGLSQAEPIYQYFAQNGIEEAQIVDFLKGYNEGVEMLSKEDKAYMLGLQIGHMVSKVWVDGMNQEIFAGDSTMSVNRSLMVEGFRNGILKNYEDMDMMKAKGYAQTMKNDIKKRFIEEKYADYKAANEKFLEENKAKEGVVTLPSGLQYKVITEGKGAIPTKTDKVKVNYRGTLIDGTEFDSSYKRKDKDGNPQPTEFRTNQVIKGWSEALQLMPVGSKWEIYIPQELAYGIQARGEHIKPFSALVFEVELLEIVVPAKKK